MKDVNKKMDLAMNDLLSRQDYLVTQANDLARSFGNLTAFEHKVLDFCFSFVEKEHTSDHVYRTTVLDIIHHFGLGASGRNYQRVANAFKALNSKTAIYLRKIRPDGTRSIVMTSLFNYIELVETGEFEFQFTKPVAPYIFQLKERFYSFKLSELSKVRGKYTLTLLKLWNANCMGKLSNVTIQGTLEDWESWFLGSDEDGNPKKMSASRFKASVLIRACEELERIYPVTISLTTQVMRRKVVGYKLDIVRLEEQNS